MLREELRASDGVYPCLLPGPDAFLARIARDCETTSATADRLKSAPFCNLDISVGFDFCLRHLCGHLTVKFSGALASRKHNGDEAF